MNLRNKTLPLALLVLIFHLLPISLSAQEVLLPLQHMDSQHSAAAKSSAAVGLPFFDDFAKPALNHQLSTFNWEPGGATVGTGYGELPPTIGMATLDAIGPDGNLYPQASTSPFPADTLCSRPLRLDSISPADSLVLSFFYLPGGGSGNLWERIGDTPDDGDSLFLDLYRAADSTWQTVWSRGGISIDTLVAHTGKAWQYVAIAIADPLYFDSTFRFRFRNRCSLESTNKPGMSGNCDQWNIDYVLLDTARSVTATPHWRDIAFVVPAPSALTSYRAMPARQYRNSELAANLPMTITNLYGSELASHYQYCIIDSNGDTVHRYDGGFENAPTTGYQTIAAHALPPMNYTFPESTTQSTYTFVHTVSEGVAGDNRPLNDTVRFQQVFGDYYAYDDGSAENGYGLTSTASRVYLAYRFDLNTEDTLTAVNMSFNRTINGENEGIQFYLTVWQADADGRPGTVLYRDEQRRRPVVDDLDHFNTYILESPTIVYGSIFVGFEQVGNNFINLGFDRNTQSADRIWYLTSTEWQQSILRGSLMLRPRFGESGTVGIDERRIESDKWRVWPNPANDIIHIDGLPDGAMVQIYDMTGRLRLSAPHSPISTRTLSTGIYLLRIVTDDGNVSHTKLVINH